MSRRKRKREEGLEYEGMRGSSCQSCSGDDTELGRKELSVLEIHVKYTRNSACNQPCMRVGITNYVFACITGLLLLSLDRHRMYYYLY